MRRDLSLGIDFNPVQVFGVVDISQNKIIEDNEYFYTQILRFDLLDTSTGSMMDFEGIIEFDIISDIEMNGHVRYVHSPSNGAISHYLKFTFTGEGTPDDAYILATIRENSITFLLQPDVVVSTMYHVNICNLVCSPDFLLKCNIISDNTLGAVPSTGVSVNGYPALTTIYADVIDEGIISARDIYFDDGTTLNMWHDTVEGDLNRAVYRSGTASGASTLSLDNNPEQVIDNDSDQVVENVSDQSVVEEEVVK